MQIDTAEGPKGTAACQVLGGARRRERSHPLVDGSHIGGPVTVAGEGIHQMVLLNVGPLNSAPSVRAPGCGGQERASPPKEPGSRRTNHQFGVPLRQLLDP